MIMTKEQYDIIQKHQHRVIIRQGSEGVRMTNYERGRAKEYRVATKLRKDGWLVIRSAGSHSEFDLVAIKHEQKQNPLPPFIITYNNEIKLIQCKSGKSKLRMVKDVLKSDIKRFEGLYQVSVEVV